MEAIVRLTAFFGIFALLAFLEIIAPRRELSVSKAWRWFTNLSLTGLDMVIVRLLFGTATIQTALFAQEHGWGLLNYLHLPAWLAFLTAIIFLDFMIYIQHVMFHALPIFWRLHLVHHTDLDFDVTTAARFHPIEIIVSLIFKLGLIVTIGAAPVAVLVFEIILNGETDLAVRTARDIITDISKGEAPVEKLVISRSCKDFRSYKDPDSQTTVQTAKKLMEMGYDFVPGMKVSWVVTNAQRSPLEAEPFISGKKFEKEPDYDYYARRVAMTLARVTDVFGWDMNNLMTGTQQKTLFGDGFDLDDDDETIKKKEKPEVKKTEKKLTLEDFL